MGEIIIFFFWGNIKIDSDKRKDFFYLFRRFHYLTTCNGDGDNISLGWLDFGQDIAEFFIGNPASLLGIIGFRLIDTFLFEWDEQPLWGIGIITFLFHDLWHDELIYKWDSRWGKIRNRDTWFFLKSFFSPIRSPGKILNIKKFLKINIFFCSFVLSW